MREIKYRAWVKRAQQMASWKEIQEKQNLHRLIGNPDYPLMQYTGLTDANDVEIYEGDIVRFCVVEGEPGEKRRESEIGEVKVHPLGVWLGDWDYLWCEQIEVVGNIYENKELAKAM
ncbi:YopX family protein [Sansalvadorimonas verongulae]|uniref:YopX family protein n=1 Tax=Sansalvadorimonas verongulae TaxID=2172824 RepID=UPI0012BBD1A0|nr:YopX family protein [Sansalvadorimonas verongulae]MTI12826.1 hypothetical protein [Sansalvadorimonas verongulae]